MEKIRNNLKIIFSLLVIFLELYPINCQKDESSSVSNDCRMGEIIQTNNEPSCFSNSNSNYVCCILKKFRLDRDDIPTNICWGFSKDNIQDIYSYNAYNYKVLCEKDFYRTDIVDNYSIAVDQSHLKSCGNDRPETVSDCTDASDSTGSCCLYTYNSIKQCTKLAKRYLGTITYGGLNIQCEGTFMKFYYSFFIFITLFVLIFL